MHGRKSSFHLDTGYTHALACEGGDVKKKAQRVDIKIDNKRKIHIKCPDERKFYRLYDNAAERLYRHPNTCQMATYPLRYE